MNTEIKIIITKIEEETKKQKITDKISWPFAVIILVIIFGLVVTRPETEYIKNWMITAFILGGILIIFRFLTETFYGGRINKLQIKVIMDYYGGDDALLKKLRGMLNRQVDDIYQDLIKNKLQV